MVEKWIKIVARGGLLSAGILHYPRGQS